MTDRVQDKITSVFYDEQLQGRMHLNNSAFELALQAFTNCLHMCETWRGLSEFKYEVVGNIGWVNRLIGRYDVAIQNLQEALRLSDVEPPTLERVQIETELGTVYRLTDRHDEARAVFNHQYSLAKKQIAELEKHGNTEEAYSWKRVACRAIGNLGLANYQRALRLMSEAENPDARDAKKKAKGRIHHAMGQLRERVRLAREIEADSETPRGRSHGRNSRLSQAICWQCIGYSRLSLCHSALADLELGDDSRMMHLKKAVEISEKGARLALHESVQTLSRFFHGRALLRWAKHQQTDVTSNSESPIPEAYKEQILHYFGPQVRWALSTGEEASYEIVTPAIRLAMEPSTEHRGYLRELVEAGADFGSIDPKTGYTALDYAIFSGDVQTQEIVIDGLHRQNRARTGNPLPNREVECLKQEARLKKGYREIFQEKLRPELMKAGQGIHRWEQDEKEKARNRTTRRRALRHLRRVYAAALDADKDMGAMFDRLKVIPYKDFVEFGKLPRSSDGLAKTFDVAVSSLGRDGPGPKDDDKDQGEVVLFFSYRWINTDPNLNSPDDANRTQYKRMVDAVRSYVKNQNGLISSEQVLIWMDFACVDQDNPTAGVSALPFLISQCDALITLQDDTYFDRAWCSVEADMIQTLRDEYYLHEWLEQVPNTSYEEQTYNVIEDVQCDRDYETSKGDDVTQWQLRSAKERYNLNTGDKKLSRETDRPKVLFLERQTSLLKWSPG